MVAGEHAWLPGGVHSCQGACVVAGGVHGCGGHAWLPGGMHGCQGACVVAGGMHGCWGVCMVAGGMHGCLGACVVARGACKGYDEIRSMNGRYASYWNAFLYQKKKHKCAHPIQLTISFG